MYINLYMLHHDCNEPSNIFKKVYKILYCLHDEVTCWVQRKINLKHSGVWKAEGKYIIKDNGKMLVAPRHFI